MDERTQRGKMDPLKYYLNISWMNVHIVVICSYMLI